MSTRVLPGPHPRVELVVRIDGEYRQTGLRDLARALAELAVLPFRDRSELTLPFLVLGRSLPLFGRMRQVLLTHWSAAGPQWLPAQDPPVLLVLAIPLHDSEIRALHSVGEAELLRTLLLRGRNWYDPDRPKDLHLMHLEKK